MDWIREHIRGVLLCLAIAMPSWFRGQAFPVVGGPVIGILRGMCVTLLI